MSREKQIIDEMAGVIYNDSRLNCEIVEAVKISEALYNAGYRKQSENTVEVVRCNDCTDKQAYPDGMLRCRRTGRNMNADDFCSRGAHMKGGAK